MNNVVSLETAIKLAANGFPQMDGDETWEDGLYWCTWEEDRRELSLFRGGEVDEFGHDPIAYAPCATELLPTRWNLIKVEDGWEAVQSDALINWHLNGGSITVFKNSNPADAAAEAWLYVNQNKEQ